MTPQPRAMHDHPRPFCGQGCPAFGDVWAKYPSTADWEAHVRERQPPRVPRTAAGRALLNEGIDATFGTIAREEWTAAVIAIEDEMEQLARVPREAHRLMMPPHPGDVYRQSALCSCGNWQWDGDSTVLDYRAVLHDHAAHAALTAAPADTSSILGAWEVIEREYPPATVARLRAVLVEAAPHKVVKFVEVIEEITEDEIK